MKTFGLLLLLAPIISFSQKGTISGNVYFNYNQYVGNRADAGSDIFIVKKGGEITRKAKADLQGNYEINDVDTGYNYILTVSRNTNDDPKNTIYHYSLIIRWLKLKNNDSLYEDSKSKSHKYDSIYGINSLSTYNLNKKEQKQADLFNSNLQTEKDNISKEYYNSVDKYISWCHENNKDFFNSLGLLNFRIQSKIDVGIEKIADGKITKVIVDFGNTYL